jgi:two-component system LytT family response regulator
MTLRVLIVDDEQPARRRLMMMLRQIPAVTVVGEASGGEQALGLVRALLPDVLLLDIAMPGMDGFDVLPQLESAHLPVVIFVTAFHQHAVRAFDWAATDYLLKPVAFDRLEMALERAGAVLKAREASSEIEELRGVLEAVREPAGEPSVGYSDEIWVQRRTGYARVKVETIEFVQADRDYVRLFAGGHTFMMRDTLTDLCQRLDPVEFLRVHRSYVVRRAGIQQVLRARNGALSVVLASGVTCPVGRTFAGEIRSFLN